MQKPVLACVYTCEQHRPLHESFYSSPIGRHLLGSPQIRLLEVYANPDAPASHQEDGKLILRAAERYDSLSLKTLEMIRYCVAHFGFERLLKVDVTAAKVTFDEPEYEGRKPLDLDELARFLQDSPLDADYDGFVLHRAASRENAEEWARKKGRGIDYARIFGDAPMPAFFSGKCYFLGRTFAEFVARHGADIAQEQSDYFLGAEDVMIGRLHKIFRDTAA